MGAQLEQRGEMDIGPALRFQSQPEATRLTWVEIPGGMWGRQDETPFLYLRASTHVTLAVLQAN